MTPPPPEELFVRLIDCRRRLIEARAGGGGCWDVAGTCCPVSRSGTLTSSIIQRWIAASMSNWTERTNEPKSGRAVWTGTLWKLPRGRNAEKENMRRISVRNYAKRATVWKARVAIAIWELTYEMDRCRWCPCCDELSIFKRLACYLRYLSRILSYNSLVWYTLQFLGFSFIHLTFSLCLRVYFTFQLQLASLSRAANLNWYDFYNVRGKIDCSLIIVCAHGEIKMLCSIKWILQTTLKALMLLLKRDLYVRRNELALISSAVRDRLEL